MYGAHRVALQEGASSAQVMVRYPAENGDAAQ